MRTILFASLILCLPLTARATDPASLEQFQQRLTSEKFAERQAAQADLAKLPPSRIAEILRAAAANADTEVKARLESAAWSIAARQLSTQATAVAPVRAHLRGRVVDEANKPLGGARVNARSAAIGHELWSGCEFRTTTGDDGRFDIPVPFTEINYYIAAEYTNHANTWRYTLPQEKPIADLVCRAYPSQPRVLTGTLLDENGSPLSNHPFQILGEYQDLLTTTTDVHGQFKFEKLPYLGQAIPIARHGDTVAPIMIIREAVAQKIPPRITLARAATLKGTVLSNDNHPLAGATVRIRPDFCSGLRFTAKTDKDGAYNFTGLPPGNYIVTADSPAHLRVPPRGSEFELPPATLEPGKTTVHDIRLQPMGIACGRVLDTSKKPVPGAMVAICANYRDAASEKWSFVWTDNDGLFCIGTGRSEALPLIAFTAEHGTARLTVQPIRPGTVVVADLTLPGSLRIKGTVIDAAGKPIPNVWCIGSTVEVRALTAADGAFDLGRVSRGGPARDQLPCVNLRAPRPAPGDDYNITSAFDSQYVRVTSRDKAPQFFKHGTLAPVDPTSADNLRVILPPAELLEISGKVSDAAGKLLPNASLNLFAGNANPKTWAEFAHPREPTGGGRLIIHDVPIAATHTDENGRFRFWTIRNDSTQFSRPQIDQSKYSIGIWTPAANTLKQNIDVPKDKSTLELTLDLKD